MKEKMIAYSQLSMGMILAGSSVVTGKILVENIPLFISQLLSLLVALICIIPFALILEGNPFKAHFKKQDLIYLGLQSFMGMFLFRILLLEGLKRTGALEGGIITGTTPVVIVILSIVILKESITSRTVIGIVLCVSGMIIINIMAETTGQTTSEYSHIIGNIFIFGAVISESLFSIFRKLLSFNDKPITSTMIIIIISLLLFTPFGINELRDYSLNQLNLNMMIAIFYYGAFCTVISYIFWFSGIAKVKASIAASFAGLMPITSILLSVLFLGEVVGFKDVLGIATILSGIIIITHSTFRSPVKL